MTDTIDMEGVIYPKIAAKSFVEGDTCSPTVDDRCVAIFAADGIFKGLLPMTFDQALNYAQTTCD